MMPNRPEYMAIWLGITGVGGVVALINTNLRGPALAHCIDIVAPKHLIVAADYCADASNPFRLDIFPAQPKIWIARRRQRSLAHRPRGRTAFSPSG